MDVLSRMGLMLPSEAQWEYAARAGTTTSWWTGAEEASLAGCANVFDLANTRDRQAGMATASFDDGFVYHAPVAALRANPFGLHETVGNVHEWCQDEYPEHGKVVRGGGFNDLPSVARSAFGYPFKADYRHHALGVRPARAVEE
jgi:formylglycine-generating enzyme required for sulfatase activity